MTHARTAAAWFFLLTLGACLGLFGSWHARITAPNPSYEAEQAERAALRYLQHHVNQWDRVGPATEERRTSAR